LKKFMIALGIFMMSVAGIANAQEVNEQNPYEMVQDVANRTFERIKANQAAIKADPEMLRTIMEEELVPYIDYKFSLLLWY